VRWLCEPKLWYAPNASTLLEALDSGQATSPQSAAGLVQLCFGFVARKLRNTGAGWRRAFDPDDPVAGFPHAGLPGGAEGIRTLSPPQLCIDSSASDWPWRCTDPPTILVRVGRKRDSDK
jgi:hypothetical protein